MSLEIWTLYQLLEREMRMHDYEDDEEEEDED